MKKMNSLQKPPLHELTHFGVLGMKWGVRNEEKPVGRKRYSIPEKKRAHRVRLEAKYLKEGHSNDEAEQMAAKRIKGEKIALGILGTAAVAGASYLAYQEIGKRYLKVVLEAGKDLHYVNALGDKADYNRRLYTSFQKGDTAKYKGLLATALRRNAEDTTIYDTVLRTTETIKAPSHNEATKLYKEFVGKSVKGSDYNIFNRNLVAYWDDPESKGFIDFLKNKGYNAILDSNDQFLSGYNTKKPLILFNAASSTVKVGESIVEKAMSDKLNNLQMLGINSKALAPLIGLGMAFIGGVAALDTSSKYGAVNSFVKANAKSTYSYGELYNSLSKRTINGVTTYVVNEEKLKGA